MQKPILYIEIPYTLGVPRQKPSKVADEPNASLFAKPAAPGLLGQMGSVACAWVELGLKSEKAPTLLKLRMVVMRDFFSRDMVLKSEDKRE